MARLIAIGETDAEGEEIARAGAQWTVGAYATGKRVDNEGKPVDPVRRYVDDVVIHGSVDSVVDQIQRRQEEIKLDYLLCSPLSHGSFMRFTEQVLPRVC
ncbi:MAG: hypothetical protein V3R95_02405 [Dehalococcoidia bacterium]